MNKGLNQKLHSKSQRKQYKNLSLEYKKLVNETVPDLWERIEAGIEVSRGEDQIEADNCLQREEVPIFFKHRAGSLADASTSLQIKSNIIRKIAVAACVCLVAVPLLFIVVSDLSKQGRKDAESGSCADYMADGAADYEIADNAIVDYDMTGSAIADKTLKDSIITNNDAASVDNSIPSEDAYNTDHSAAAGSIAGQTEQAITDNADGDICASIIVTATVLEVEAQDNVNVYTIQIDDLGERRKLEDDVLEVPDRSDADDLEVSDKSDADSLEVPDRSDADGLNVPDKPDVSELPNISESGIFMKPLEIGSQIQVYSQSDTATELTVGRQYKLKLLIRKEGETVIYLY